MIPLRVSSLDDLTGRSKKRSRFTVVPKERRTMDGVVYDSEREMVRFAKLKLEERAGMITHLRYQPAFKVSINGHHYCTFTADASYFKDGELVVEDTKSTGTRKDTAYRLRKRAVEQFHNIKITEVL